MPGSVQAQVTSVESNSNLIVDSHVQNEGNGWAGSGANPWHLDENTESILFLTNESDKRARIGFSVTANGVHYSLTELRLSPHETRVIDLRKLRDAQLPDFKKHLIPASATDGSVCWNRIDNVAVMGRLMVISRQQGMASSYDCCICPCPASYEPGLDYLSPESFDLLVGSSAGLILYGGFLGCGSIVYYADVNTDDPTWNSASASIATVNSSGVVTGQSGGTTSITGAYAGDSWGYSLVSPPYGYECLGFPLQGGASGTPNVTPHITSISPALGLIGANTTVTISGSGFGSSQGTSTVSAGSNITFSLSGSGNFWSDTLIYGTFQVASNAPSGNQSVTVTTAVGASNSVNFYVQIPTSLSIVTGSSSTTSEASCTTSGGLAGCGVTRTLSYQVNDQAGNPIQVVNMPVGDVICNTSTNQLNSQSYTTTCGGTTGSCSGTAGPCNKYTTATGQFLDTLNVCAPACTSSGACCTDGNTVANQTWTVAGYALSSDVKTLTYQCNQILVNGN
jgi:hypothetical protein